MWTKQGPSLSPLIVVNDTRVSLEAPESGQWGHEPIMCGGVLCGVCSSGTYYVTLIYRKRRDQQELHICSTERDDALATTRKKSPLVCEYQYSRCTSQCTGRGEPPLRPARVIIGGTGAKRPPLRND